jgi:hypothetical protein
VHRFWLRRVDFLENNQTEDYLLKNSNFFRKLRAFSRLIVQSSLLHSLMVRPSTACVINIPDYATEESVVDFFVTIGGRPTATIIDRMSTDGESLRSAFVKFTNVKLFQQAIDEAITPIPVVFESASSRKDEERRMGPNHPLLPERQQDSDGFDNSRCV